jgi:ribosomal protein L44E
MKPSISFQQHTIDSLVEKYSNHVDRDIKFYRKDEGYKFKAVETFKKEFNLNAKDFHGMMEKALEDAHNLVQSAQYFPKRMLLKFIKHDPQFMRRELGQLLNGQKPVADRIDAFKINVEKKLKKPNEKTYFDYRFLSFLLASHHPNLYFYVKSSEYKEFAEIIGHELVINGSQGERYRELLGFAEALRESLKANSRFGVTHKKITQGLNYKDESLSWGTFDFIYNVVHRKDLPTEEIKTKSRWLKKIGMLTEEQQETLVLEDEIQEELQGKSKEELLEEARKFKSLKKGYSEKEGRYKVRRDDVTQKIRVRIIEDYKCQVCGFTLEYRDFRGKKKKYIQVDHIIEKIRGGTEELGNLWVLCPNCHIKKTIGVILIDPENKIVKENGKILQIRDNHLDWWS